MAATIRWLIQRFGRKPFGPQIHDGPPHDFELRPVSFMVDLVQSIPFVELRYYAINYLNHELTLTETKVTQFRISSGPTIEHIPLAQDFSVAPKSSFPVFFRRNLLDSEVRAHSQQKIQLPENASFSLIAKARCRRREKHKGSRETQGVKS